jgi:hypothetical protein
MRVRRFFLLTAMAAFAATAQATDAAAQAAGACTYDRCALRVQPPTFATPLMLVRGAHGEEVIRLGLLEPAVAPWVMLSDSAVAHARVYDLLYDRGSLLNITGTIIAIGAPVLLRGTMQKIAFTGAGIGMTVYGGHLLNQANDALNRALWWYNRELPR